MAMLPSEFKETDEYITVTIRNKANKSCAANSITAFLAADLETILPTGVTDLTGYDKLGLLSFGYAGSAFSCCILAVLPDNPYIAVYNPTNSAQTATSHYLYMTVRYKKKQ